MYCSFGKNVVPWKQKLLKTCISLIEAHTQLLPAPRVFESDQKFYLAYLIICAFIANFAVYFKIVIYLLEACYRRSLHNPAAYH